MFKKAIPSGGKIELAFRRVSVAPQSDSADKRSGANERRHCNLLKTRICSATQRT
jgi:hypothetical protein